MQKETLALAAVVALTFGCRSSEETSRAAGDVPARTETVQADDDREHPRDPDESKRIGEVNRAEGRRDAAEERDRRIDEEPLEPPPAPPGEEEPPR